MLAGGGSGAGPGVPTNHREMSTTTSAPEFEYTATPIGEAGAPAIAAATSDAVLPLTVLVGGMSWRAAYAVRYPGRIGLTIVTLSAIAAALGAPFGIST